jgi:hypothetical protein
MRAQLLAALEESLAATPDPADVLGGIHSGIERRRRRNHYYRTGIAITAIVIVLIVSMAAASAIPMARDRTPAAIPVGTWRNSIELTWLPPGMTVQSASSTAAWESIVYSGTSGLLSVFVDTLDRHRTLDEPDWKPTEIDGRPARERSSGNDHVEFSLLLPSGRWADLSWLTMPLPGEPPDLHEDALRVARGLRDSGDLRLRPGFAPSYLPKGIRIIGVEADRGDPGGGGSILCVSGSLQLTDMVGPSPAAMNGGTARHRLPELGPGVQIKVTNIVTKSATHRIADIQGRPAYKSLSDGSLLVEDFHGGKLIVDTTRDDMAWPSLLDPLEPPQVPFDELVKIAENVRWNG